jgi:hypothetical protein
MRCLNVVWVVIPPRSSHSFWIPVVGNHIVIVCELFVADGTLLILFDNLAIQQFPHFSQGPEFPISPRVMRVLNASNPRLQSACVGRLLPAAAGNRFVNWAVFIATKPHSNPPREADLEICCGEREIGRERPDGGLSPSTPRRPYARSNRNW